MRRIIFTLIVLLVLAFPAYAQQPVKVVDSAGADVPVATTTEAAHDAVLGTLTNIKSLMDLCRTVSGTPTIAGSTDRSFLAWCNMYGARATFPVANDAGGDTPCYQATTASTNAKSCKTTAGTVYELSAVNTTATLYYLRIYDLAGGTPTCSSATGYVETIPVPASTTGAGIVRTYPVGRAFAAGIGWCVTGGSSSTDNTNAATGVFITLGYK